MTSTYPLGVVIGRFQVAELHGGHRHLIDHAADRHPNVLVIIGSSRGYPTVRNPLSFTVRRAMVLAEYPNASVVELHDNPSDEEWSKRVDALIGALYPDSKAILYGSRDSFIPHYSGSYEVAVVPKIASVSGSEIRAQVQSELLHTPEWRRGIIHVHATRAALPYPVVDVAVVNPNTETVLLGQKKHDGEKYRFIGGFYDPAVDTSFEATVAREVIEETGGIEVGNISYLGSGRIDDWRYRGEKDCIVSAFYRADYLFGAARAQDDLDSLAWIPYSNVLDVLIPEHRKAFGDRLMHSLTTNRKETS